MRKYYIFLGLVVFFFLSYKACPNAFGNYFNLFADSGFFIPKESNACVFRETMPNYYGSGEYWLYGEDNKYYYGVNGDYKSESDPSYFLLKKGEESKNFNKHDYKTWDMKVGSKPRGIRTGLGGNLKGYGSLRVKKIWSLRCVGQ